MMAEMGVSNVLEAVPQAYVGRARRSEASKAIDSPARPLSFLVAKLSLSTINSYRRFEKDAEVDRLERLRFIHEMDEIGPMSNLERRLLTRSLEYADYRVGLGGLEFSDSSAAQGIQSQNSRPNGNTESELSGNHTESEQQAAGHRELVEWDSEA